MATYTSNYGWTKPSGSDNVDISVLNNNLDDQDSTIHDAFLNMAPPFSESSTYAVDDIVLYETGLYKCHTAVVTPGSWTGSTNWQVYKLSEGGGGGLTLGETSSTAYRGDRGKTAYDHSQSTGNPHGTTASDVGLGNVPNVSTNDQKPTFTEASTRNNIASGEKLSVILGKVQKFFNDLKTVAFSGSYTDLSNKPSIPTKTSDLTNDSNFVSDANYVHTDNNFTASEKTKLAGIASGAEANVQANWSQTNTSADDFIKNKPSLATVATSGSYNDLSNKPTIPAAQVNSDWNASSGVAEILNKPSSYTPSSHKHGNIQNGGTLQTTDVAIANGDKLVVTDSSNSAKIARTSVAFDGTTTTQALSKKGTFETFSKFSGSYIDLTNKPSINSVELSGNKTTSDLGINADNVMLSDGVTSVEDALDEVADAFCINPNSGYTLLNLSVQAGSSYTAPATGLYVLYVVAPGDNVTAAWYLNSNNTQIICGSDITGTIINIVPLKKGTTIYTRATYGTYTVKGYITT